jgi:hypothetical protein
LGTGACGAAARCRDTGDRLDERLETNFGWAVVFEYLESPFGKFKSREASWGEDSAISGVSQPASLIAVAAETPEYCR